MPTTPVRAPRLAEQQEEIARWQAGDLVSEMLAGQPDRDLERSCGPCARAERCVLHTSLHFEGIPAEE